MHTQVVHSSQYLWDYDGRSSALLLRNSSPLYRWFLALKPRSWLNRIVEGNGRFARRTTSRKSRVCSVASCAAETAATRSAASGCSLGAKPSRCLLAGLSRRARRLGRDFALFHEAQHAASFSSESLVVCRLWQRPCPHGRAMGEPTILSETSWTCRQRSHNFLSKQSSLEGAEYGRDHGVVTFVEGQLHFEGFRARFSLPSASLSNQRITSFGSKQVSYESYYLEWEGGGIRGTVRLTPCDKVEGVGSDLRAQFDRLFCPWLADKSKEAEAILPPIKPQSGKLRKVKILYCPRGGRNSHIDNSPSL